MPTIEEKNSTIYEYMGCPKPLCEYVNGDEVEWDFTPNYHLSWNSLMPVWIRLKDELRNCMLPDSGDIGATAQHLFEWTKSYVSEGDIKNAHQKIYEAIEWLNQNKEK